MSLPKAKNAPKKSANKQSALEKREEKLHKDLDGDGERGESPAHRAKVLGKVAGKNAMKVAGAPLFPKQLHPSGSKAKVMKPSSKSSK